MSGTSNGNGTTTVRWIAIVVGILLFAGTVAFGAVQATMNAQLRVRVEKVEKNADDISTLESDQAVINTKLDNIKEDLETINNKLDKLAD